MSAQRYAFGPFVLDMSRGVLTRADQPVAVGHKGLLLLQALLQANGQACSKAALIDAAWPGAAVEESNLSVQIAALRKLLGPASDGGDWIATIPRVGYRFVGELTPQNSPDSAPASLSTVAPGDSRPRPSIAVLPFSNPSGESDQDYLADGITEDIITALTRFRWFFVIARNTTFAYRGKSIDVRLIARDLDVRYLLEGSVRKSRQGLRVSAQLVDAATGTHIWAERYDLEPAEVFAIQDEIAERVAGAIEPELLRSESVLAVARHTGNMTAWDLVRQGTWYFHQVTCETHVKARELFREACMLDPDLPEAHIWLARVNAGVVAYGWSDRSEMDIREGINAAFKAIHLDERNPYSHYALAITSAYGNAPEQAVSAAEKAVEISPSFALGHLVLGMTHLFNGRAAEAIEPLGRGLKLNPYDPQNFVWYNLLALAQFFADRTDEALASALTAVKVRPNWRPTFEILALCQAAQGHLDEAHRWISRMRELQKPTGDALAPLKRQNPPWRDRIERALREAGWEE